MKTITLTFISLWLSLAAFSQTSLYGKITDEESNEPLLFASVVIYKNGVLIYGVETDLDGNYSFSNIDPGTYDIEASYVGYSAVRVSKVKVFAGKANELDIQMKAGGVTLNEVVVIEYKVPLIQQDNTTSGMTITSGNLYAHYGKVGGLLQGNKKRNKRKSAPNGNITLRGSRNSSTDYYVDGIRVQGDLISEKKADKQHLKSKKRLKENAFIKPTKEATSTFSIDVDRASYSNIRQYIQHEQLPPKEVVRIEEMVNYFNYDYEGPSDKHPFAIHKELSICPWETNHHLLKIGIQGKTIPQSQIPPSNFILLLDASGSMNSPNKLPLAKKTFKKLIKTLRPEDKAAILMFSDNGQVALPFTSGTQITTIINALDAVRIDGGTNGEAGLRLAYSEAEKIHKKGENTRILVASDGDFNIGASSFPEVEKLIEDQRERGIYLSILGFGTGNYQDAKLEVLADKGNGNYAYIDNVMEARKVLEEELEQTLYTIAEDVKIQIDFNPDFIASYRLIGYENRLMAKEDFEDDTKDAGELGPGHTVTALYELVLTNQAKNQPDVHLVDLKLRYKLPQVEQSYFVKTTQKADVLSPGATSDNFRFAASVAAFGMLLQESKYLENFNQSDIIALAKKAKGEDTFGYRQEFIELVKASKQLGMVAKR